ncbi:hypothetical protein CDV55_102987 [Aspergillus turcosus]|nr:hypothetical protein CDV55_102987 [Aspergillus turcosus]
MASCSSCYKPTCPGAGSCSTLYAISDLVVTYAQSDQMPAFPLNAATTASTTQHLSAEQAPIDESDDEEDWETKLAIAATECVYRFRDVQLSAPPFPFRQRWDMDARQVISERKNRGTKRKRREYEDYDEEDHEYLDNEETQRIQDLMAATLESIAAMDASDPAARAAMLESIAALDTSVLPPAKRRKKAMKKKNKGRAAGEGVAGPAPAGGSA